MRINYAIVLVSDMKRSISFYLPRQPTRRRQGHD